MTVVSESPVIRGSQRQTQYPGTDSGYSAKRQLRSAPSSVQIPGKHRHIDAPDRSPHNISACESSSQAWKQFCPWMRK
jgi:hypothetical protein